jgi:SpoIID/LytB domain protein
VLLAAALTLGVLPGVAAGQTEPGDGVPLRADVAEQAEPAPDVVLRGSGWGHSVGMSQYGAYAQSRAGRSAEQILAHYYPGTRLRTYGGDQRVTVTAITGAPASSAVAARGDDVTWSICDSDGTCRPEVQPRDRIWTLISGGDANPSRVTLCSQDLKANTTTRPTCGPDDVVYRGPDMSSGAATAAGGEVALADGANAAGEATAGEASRYEASGDGTARTGTAATDQAATEAAAAEDVSLSVRLTSRATTQPAGERIQFGSSAAVNACGAQGPTCRQYAYGWLTVRGVGGSLEIDNALPLASYLRGLGEVPSGWGRTGGQQALEAQAIIARGFVLQRGRTTCATPACQVFVGYGKEIDFAGDRWVAAVTGTAGRYLEAPDGDIAQTFYSSSHGGRTEASRDSWAYGGAVPYLVSVDDPWSLTELNPMRSWTTVASSAEFHRVAGAELSRIERIAITSRTAGGSPRTLAVEGPEGVNTFDTTPPPARASRGCNRAGYAGNSLRCDLRGAVTNAAGAPFAGAGGNPPSSQIRSIGFAPFTDDDGTTHEYATVFTQEAGIAAGFDKVTFGPQRDVTRGQMASFLYRTFDVPDAESTSFRDARSGEHAAAIRAVAAAGIAEGYTKQEFGVDDPVTRQQMATFLVRAMGLTPTEPDFDDVEPGGAHGGNVGAIAASKITDGCALRAFCPNEPVSRGQMATFLHRAVRSLR